MTKQALEKINIYQRSRAHTNRRMQICRLFPVRPQTKSCAAYDEFILNWLYFFIANVFILNNC